jgi:hypothetical protein
MKTSIATIGVLAAANCDLFEMLQGSGVTKMKLSRPHEEPVFRLIYIAICCLKSALSDIVLNSVFGKPE